MQRLHVHKPDWIHIHKPDFHQLKPRFEKLISDPRFWAGVVLVLLFGTLFFIRYG